MLSIRRLLLLGVIVSEISTAIIVSIMSILFHGKITSDLMITGTVTAFLVSLFVCFFLVTLIRQLKESEEDLKQSEEKGHAIINAITDGLVIIDDEGRVIYWNSAAEKIFGYTEEEIMGRELHPIVIPEKFNKAYRKGFDAFRLTGHGSAIGIGKINEFPAIRKDGVELLIEVSVSPFQIKEKWNAVGIIRNITGRKKAEENIRLAAKVMESALEGIFVTDSKFNITTVNPAFNDITGLSCEEVKGKYPAIMAAGHHDVGIYMEVWDTIRFGGIWQGEIGNRHKSGAAYVSWMNVSAIKDDEGNISNYVGVFTDITRRKVTEEHLKHMANYDMLTELPNKSLFSELLNHAMAQAKREKKMLAVMFLDLDNFKPVNDTYGHDIGDMLLKEATQRLKECIRQSDTVSRLSGDEFAVILNQIGDISNAVLVAQKILLTHSNPFYLGGYKISVSVSIGISLYPEDGIDAVTLLKNADTAMYLAKNSGKNSYRLFSEKIDSDLHTMK